jgi:hypothetical protein
MTITAFDLSLTATGYAQSIDSAIEFGTIISKLKGMPRLEDIRSKCLAKAYPAKKNSKDKSDLVIFEDLAFAAHDRNHERAGLATLIRHSLWKEKIPYVLAAPTSLKKFISGSGKAEKSLMMLEVYKRFNLTPKNDNEADAIGLLYLGLMLSGQLGTQNKAQEEVLATVRKNNAEALKEAGL